MRLLGVDIGGTTIKLGLFTEIGDCLSKTEIDTNKLADGESLLDKIIREMTSFTPFDAIGISSAGQVNPQAGIIVKGSVNIPGMDGLRIKELLETTFNVPVSIENDVNAAALGENYFGVGRNISEFLFLTYGTGIGGAIIHKSSLFYGEGAFAGEFGHMITHRNGLVCNCGMQGCYESYASTTALVRKAKNMNESYKNGRIIFEKWREGNVQVEKLVEEWVEEIAIGLASLIHIFNPSTVIIGGGIMEQEVLIEKIQKRVDALILSSFKEVTLVKASLGNQSGMLGAISAHLPSKGK